MAIDGTYKFFQKTPIGEMEGEFTFVTDGSNLKGCTTSPYGEKEIQNGRIDGNKLNWHVKAGIPGPTGEMSITFTATVDGDRIEGESRMEAFPPSRFVASRI